GFWRFICVFFFHSRRVHIPYWVVAHIGIPVKSLDDRVALAYSSTWLKPKALRPPIQPEAGEQNTPLFFVGRRP
ncbi:hypothetical protein S1OALGB6SA_2320, partial [Olavius algarvensis spirochete endosymbiont]